METIDSDLLFKLYEVRKLIIKYTKSNFIVELKYL